jgi:hypothetical protein
MHLRKLLALFTAVLCWDICLSQQHLDARRQAQDISDSPVLHPACAADISGLSGGFDDGIDDGAVDLDSPLSDGVVNVEDLLQVLAFWQCEVTDDARGTDGIATSVLGGQTSSHLYSHHISSHIIPSHPIPTLLIPSPSQVRPRGSLKARTAVALILLGTDRPPACTLRRTTRAPDRRSAPSSTPC